MFTPVHVCYNRVIAVACVMRAFDFALDLRFPPPDECREDLEVLDDLDDLRVALVTVLIRCAPAFDEASAPRVNADIPLMRLSPPG